MTRAASTPNPLAAWTAAALVVVTGLAILNGLASNSGVDVSPIRVASSGGDDRAAVPSSSTRAPKISTQADYTETLKRPLFTPTRRPFDPAKNKPPEPTPVNAPAPVPQAPAAPPPSLQVKLVGYTASPQRGKRALVRTANERVGTWISIGDQVDGWRLRDLNADRATFELGSQRQVLLFEANQQPTQRTQAK
jgi:hypothetical protein